MLHLQAGRLPAAAAQLQALSLTPLTPVQEKSFRDGFLLLYRDFEGKTVSQASLTNQMMKTVKLAVNSGMTFPRGAFPLIKSLMYLDGMVLQSNPDAILLQDVAEFAGDFGS
jgi:ubiquinone biosynthesis protein